MAFKVIETAGNVVLNSEKKITVQRVHVTGGRVDEVRLEGREMATTDSYNGPTKNALVFTSPQQAAEFATMLLEAANAWDQELHGVKKAAPKRRTPVKTTPARKTASRSAASRRKATAKA